MEERHIEAGPLANKAGMSYNAVYKILRGERKNPSLATLRKLASALNVHVSELAGDENLDDDVQTTVIQYRITETGIEETLLPIPPEVELRLRREAEAHGMGFAEYAINKLLRKNGAVV